jgi:hypothetical protein
MYATIRCHERDTASTDELARAGHVLATRLGAAPGFVACLLLETSGGYAAIGIFEDPESLAAADALVAAWSPAGSPAPATDRVRQIRGEVIAQKGL